MQCAVEGRRSRGCLAPGASFAQRDTTNPGESLACSKVIIGQPRVNALPQPGSSQVMSIPRKSLRKGLTSCSGCADLRPVGGTFLTFFLAGPGLYAKRRFEKVGDGYAVIQDLFRTAYWIPAACAGPINRNQESKLLSLCLVSGRTLRVFTSLRTWLPTSPSVKVRGLSNTTTPSTHLLILRWLVCICTWPFSPLHPWPQ